MIDSDVSFWKKHLTTYEHDFQDWLSKGEQIVKRYKNDNKTKKNRFNVLYSNVQTLLPSLYSQPPKPNFERRFSGDDDVGRVSSLVLERAVSYYLDGDDFDDCLRQTVLDRLLAGRGTAWVRYLPQFDGAISDDLPPPNLLYEDVVIDYVHWNDFGHTYGRTWQEVRAVWRKVMMSRKELVERFGEEIGNAVPIGAEMPMGDKSKDKQTKACIYEIWDKTTKTVFWLCCEYPKLLDKKDDPLGLKGFFPCPRPIYSQIANDNLIPVPDYWQYQDQAYELDLITTRIDLIVKAMKVAGVYASDNKGIERLLSEGAENKLIPVDNFAAMGEKGLKGVVSFFPLEMLNSTLQALYNAREAIKATIYEITGISDIIRGASVASETATAQEIKSQYATMRLGQGQRDVQRFCRDIVRIMAEIVAKHFSMDTIKQISGVELFTEMEKQQYTMMLQQQPDMPIDPKIERMLSEPTWEAVEGVLRDDMARCFRIDIETDSTIRADQEAEKASRSAFLTAASQFIVQASNVQDPTMQPLLMEMLLFGVRGFRVGKTMEAEFKLAMDRMRKKALNPPPAPDPMAEKQAELQADMQAKQMEIQAKLQEKQMDIELQREIEGMKMQSNERIENVRVTGDVEKNRMQVRGSMSPDALASEDGQLAQSMVMIAESINQMSQNLTQMAMSQEQSALAMAENQAILIEKLDRPKVATITDANGKVVRTGMIQ